ncbi:MAG: hypothetical protein JXR19_08445 [Bacteroidia bacterium]
MTNVTCPNCYHHSFEVKARTGSSLLDYAESVLVGIGIPAKWFKNVFIRCKTCKYYWRA